ncbi:MAG TPA: APC family permease [Bacteroidia bacterium]|nr:APC family permease [Bacteroidia bacterium]
MKQQIGLKEAMSIGIGGMVGGGIFAVLGLSVSLAGGGTPAAFVFAGVLALITSYSYTNLSKTYPDRGGTVKFINMGFGVGVFSGGLNNLLWISYIIMLSLYASAFASYAPNLLELTGSKSLDFHIYASVIIVLATALNYYSLKVVGKIESYAVIIKLTILIGFIIAGLSGLNSSTNLSQLDMSNWEPPLQLFAGGMVIFVAYEGFELIANVAPDIKNPEINIPRAFYGSVLFVILLYIAIATVTVGSLPFDQIKTAQDYVLAEAAKPMFGSAGFTVITFAALISTFSAINASLYGGSRVNFENAEDDELPHHFLAKLWNQPVGLMITSVATLVLVNTLDLESISTAGSLNFLLVFAVVNFIGFKLAKKIKGTRILPLTGFILCSIAFFILAHLQFNKDRNGVFVSLSIMGFCFLSEAVFKKLEKNK